MSVKFWKEDGPNDFVYKGRLDGLDTLEPSKKSLIPAQDGESTEENVVSWDSYQQNDDIVLEEGDSD